MYQYHYHYRFNSFAISAFCYFIQALQIRYDAEKIKRFPKLLAEITCVTTNRQK